MPYGYLTGVLVFGAVVVLTIAAPRRPRWLAGLAYRAASVYNEVPFLFVYLIVLSSIGPIGSGDLASPAGLVVTALAALVVLGFLYLGWRAVQERSVVEDALDAGLGAGWRGETSDDLLKRVRRQPRTARILLFPFVTRPREVVSHRDVAYGPAGRDNLLDVYQHRTRPEGAPVMICFHGGGFYGGRKSFESRALLFRLASRGWVTISANYRRRPQAGFFEHLSDAKRVIAWIRANADRFGADPSQIYLSGGSAGGTLSSIAALTQNESRYQPGFEGADTSVAGVASLYGWYGGYYEMGGPMSEFGVLGHDASGAPPFFVAHGAEDSLAVVETARRFVDHLRSSSPSPVVYAELPHGQHAFDLFHSFRFSAVVDGIEAFTAWVRSTSSGARR